MLAWLALPSCAKVIGLSDNYYLAAGGAETSGSGGETSSGGGTVGGAGSASTGGTGGTANLGAGMGGTGNMGAGLGSAGLGEAGGGDGPLFVMPAGKLVFERYTTYAAGDSKMYVVTFPGGSIGPELGATYKICSPFNGIFSPDGHQLVVGAMPYASPCPVLDRSRLELYVLDLDTPGKYQRVTVNDQPDEDPQYSPDGTFILFKHNGYTRRWVVSANPFDELSCKDPKGSYCFTSSGRPQSKPVVTDSGLACYEESLSQGDAGGDIFCFKLADGLAGKDISDNANRVLAVGHDNIYDSRPVIAPPWLYYTRWRVPAPPHVNTLERKHLSNLTEPGESCKFCLDPGVGYEDAFGLGEANLIVFSSNSGGLGHGDLFIGNFAGSASESLNDFAPGVNTAADELGAAFWRKN